MATLGRHSDSESFALHNWVPRVIFGYVVLVLVVGGMTLGWILMGSDSHDPPKKGSIASPLPGGLPADAAPNASKQAPPPRDAALVANAKKIKPLENIQKGDRVIFRGRVCIWQLWNRNINTSTIKCSGRNRFQTQTARLTPVELKK